MKKQNGKVGVPELLEELILKVVDLCIKDSEEDLIKYAEKIKLKKSKCQVCNKETYEVLRQDENIRCVICKTIKKREGELF